jgi:hypothetical protein
MARNGKMARLEAVKVGQSESNQVKAGQGWSKLVKVTRVSSFQGSVFSANL